MRISVDNPMINNHLQPLILPPAQTPLKRGRRPPDTAWPSRQSTATARLNLIGPGGGRGGAWTCPPPGQARTKPNNPWHGEAVRSCVAGDRVHDTPRGVVWHGQTAQSSGLPVPPGPAKDVMHPVQADVITLAPVPYLADPRDESPTGIGLGWELAIALLLAKNPRTARTDGVVGYVSLHKPHIASRRGGPITQSSRDWARLVSMDADHGVRCGELTLSP